MFCFRFGNLLVRLLVFEFRNIFSALVFSSISYLCDRWITRKHTAPLFYMFSVFANPSFCPTFMKKNQRVAREPGLLKRSPQQRAPGSPWLVPRLLSPTTVPEETKEIPHRSSWFIHFSFFVFYPSTSFLFQSLPACWLCMACPLPCMRLEPEKRNEKVRCSAGMHVVRPPCSWSWPRGRIIVVTPHHPPRPRSPVVRPRLRIVAVKGHDFLLNLCLLPRYVNAWSHGCWSWSQCERKILTGKYNDDYYRLESTFQK